MRFFPGGLGGVVEFCRAAAQQDVVVAHRVWPPEIQKIGWGPLNGENDDEAMDLGVPYFQTIPSSNPSSHCRKVGAVSSNTLVFGILEGYPVNHRVSQAKVSSLPYFVHPLAPI